MITSVYNTVYTSGDILAADLTAFSYPAVIRVAVAVSASAQLKLILKHNSITYTLLLNSGTALVADALYHFEFPIHKTPDGNKETFNFQLSAAATIRKLVIEELHGYEGV